MLIQSNVFLSYAADTKPLAEEIARVLRNQGIQTWADFKDLHPDSLCRDEVEQALQRAQSFIILVGPSDRTTRWQQWEWRSALEQVWTDSAKSLIPIVVGEGELPPFLRRWAALRIDPEDRSFKWADHLVGVLRTSGNNTRLGLTAKDKQVLRDRLDEIALAAVELEKMETRKYSSEVDARH